MCLRGNRENTCANRERRIIKPHRPTGPNHAPGIRNNRTLSYSGLALRNIPWNGAWSNVDERRGLNSAATGVHSGCSLRRRSRRNHRLITAIWDCRFVSDVRAIAFAVRVRVHTPALTCTASAQGNVGKEARGNTPVFLDDDH
ncbi:hypothetical protein MRX96_012015 [Rhipicephalus microplus]